ncbi:NAD(P)-binding protein [Zopfia rhizophila CBS 207.26]|uniref:NAD(P)-binding protein n=1 Tax=Zopfia rhizophila CBS 207.26 TaxID=1314779 RepID=A0A6A6DE85_9PEZI|nr:NAD(P)-binding protein [Zopfia rhizophila CBS 207.26]
MSTKYASTQPSGYNNHIKNVAIVGAAGQVGQFITTELLKKGTFDITALSRSDSTNTPPSGVTTKPIDYNDRSTLVNALKGQDVLIITMAVTAPQDQQKKLIEAAAEAGVPWIIPNEFGGDGEDDQVSADIFIGIGKKKEREYIEELGKSSWIGITCSFWYEYSLAGPGLYGIDIVKKEVTWFDDGKQRVNTSTWPQTGRAVAELLSLPVLPEDENGKATTLSHYRNRFAYVSSFTLSQRDMFESVKRVTGTSDSEWEISSVSVKKLFEDSKEKSKTGDRLAYGKMLYSRYFFPDNAGYYEVTKGLDNEKLGLPREGLDESTKKAVKLAESGYFEKIFGRN